MKTLKLYLDDIRIAPPGWTEVHSVNEAKTLILEAEENGWQIELDLDHDLGDYAPDGGDGIKLLDWLAEREKFYPVKLHTMNPVGRANMEREIRRYWPEGGYGKYY